MKNRTSQAEVSEMAKQYITEHHPLFLSNIKYQQDGSFDCSLKSDKDTISVWIATYDAEIAIGLEDRDNRTDWHIQMKSQGAGKPQQELETMTGLLNRILSDDVEIEHNSETGYELPDYHYERMRDATGNETVTVYKWSEL